MTVKVDPEVKVDFVAVMSPGPEEKNDGVKERVETIAVSALEGVKETYSLVAQPLTSERVARIKERADINPFLAKAIASGGISPFKGNPLLLKEHLETKYNVTVGSGTDQKSSGRCWIFSGLNLMRSYRLEDYGKDFEYSQNYVAFWDKFERANHFLEAMIGASELPVGSQKVQFILDKMYSDGGEWELFSNIVEKYGVVPKFAMPETTFSGRSSGYMSILKQRLKEVGGFIHKYAAEIAKMEEGSEKEEAILELRGMKDTALTEVYRVLISYLGEPPTEFYWKKPGEEVHTRTTPMEFFNESKSDIGDKVHLTHLPYIATGTKVVADDIGNVEEGRRLGSLNVSMDDIKVAVRESIKAGEPVEIACEMAHLDGDKTLLSVENDMLANIFQFDPRFHLEKGEELHYQVTTIAHGMVLVGCDDQDLLRGGEDAPATLGPLWKVENSWKDKQTLYMTDDWFEKYCYGIVVDKKFLPEETRAIYEGDSEPVHLPVWDPFCKI
jgi:bleomycin hydrolase